MNIPAVFRMYETGHKMTENERKSAINFEKIMY